MLHPAGTAVRVSEDGLLLSVLARQQPSHKIWHEVCNDHEGS